MLMLCHSRAGQEAKTGAVVNEQIRPLLPEGTKLGADPALAVARTQLMSRVGTFLQIGHQRTAALAVCRQAAAINSQYASFPVADLTLLSHLAESCEYVSATLNRLGDGTGSLAQAELAKSLIDEAVRIAGSEVDYETASAGAQERIAKAQWTLGRRREALVAFQASVAIHKRAFARDPSNRAASVMLSQAYERLVFYCSRGHDLEGAAAALKELEKLWTGDAARLKQIAGDYAALGDWVIVRGTKPLSAKETDEHDRYVRESKRVLKLAKAAALRQKTRAAAQRLGD